VLAVLSAAKSAAPNPAPVGGTLTFTVVLSNAGPIAALDVTLNDPLPAGTTFLSCSASQGSCAGPPIGSGGTVTAVLGTIGVGGTATVTIAVQAPPSSAILTNVATVTGSNVSGGSVTASASVAVGDARLADIPFLDPRMLALLTLLLVWVGFRLAKSGT
jgi:uncharacterized repeat protein (TIGR01451 family)